MSCNIKNYIGNDKLQWKKVEINRCTAIFGKVFFTLARPLPFSPVKQMAYNIYVIASSGGIWRVANHTVQTQSQSYKPQNVSRNWLYMYTQLYTLCMYMCVLKKGLTKSRSLHSSFFRRILFRSDEKKKKKTKFFFFFHPLTHVNQ